MSPNAGDNRNIYYNHINHVPINHVPNESVISHSSVAFMQAPPAVPPGGHRLPSLPYPYDALEPYISATTLCIHHDRHHLAYVEGLNKAELALVEARRSCDFSLVRYWERELAFNGSGHALHSIYWTNMSSIGGGTPGGLVLEQINSYFGSYQAFRQQLSRAAQDVEGSGWALLVWQPQWGRVEVLTAEKHEDLTQWGVIPVLVLDVWEHAYYIDYQNKRGEYIDAWWHVVNWRDVERRLRLAMQAEVPMTGAGDAGTAGNGASTGGAGGEGGQIGEGPPFPKL